MKMYRSLCLCAALALALGAGCGRKPSGPGAESETDLSQSDLFSQPVKVALPVGDPTSVVVRIGDTEITRATVNAEVARTIEMASRRMAPERLAQLQDRFAEQATENLVLKTLLTDAVQKENVTVTEEEFTNALGRFEASLPPGMTLADVQQRNQWSEEEFRNNLTLDLRINKLLETHTESAAKPTEDELKKFYEGNKERFDMPESVSARHILIAFAEEDTDAAKAQKKAKAEGLRQKLVAGADFAALAEESSDCPSKARGGDLGTFVRGQMVPPFEEAAFSQKKGDIGPVVETQFGYHIIQVTEHKDPHLMTLEEVHDRLSQALFAQNRQKAARDYIDKLRAEGNVVYVDPSAAPKPRLGPEQMMMGGPSPAPGVPPMPTPPPEPPPAP